MFYLISSVMLYQVLNSPFDSTQFSIAGAQNDREREFVFKAANSGIARFLAAIKHYTSTR